MLCDKCKQREANVHVSQNINGVLYEQNLCAECAGLNDGTFAGMGMFNSMLGPAAGDLFQNFREMSMIGAQRAEQPALPQQGGMPFEDMGLKLPDFKEEAEPKSVEPGLESVESLHAQLDDAVAKEEFEKAAELRDRIYLLEKNEREK